MFSGLRKRGNEKCVKHLWIMRARFKRVPVLLWKSTTLELVYLKVWMLSIDWAKLAWVWMQYENLSRLFSPTESHLYWVFFGERFFPASLHKSSVRVVFYLTCFDETYDSSLSHCCRRPERKLSHNPQNKVVEIRKRMFGASMEVVEQYKNEGHTTFNCWMKICLSETENIRSLKFNLFEKIPLLNCYIQIGIEWQFDHSGLIWVQVK